MAVIQAMSVQVLAFSPPLFQFSRHIEVIMGADGEAVIGIIVKSRLFYQSLDLGKMREKYGKL